MPSASSAPTRLAPIALWRIASAFLNTLHALFGAPERVAFLHTLTAKNHALMSGWLRAGEALMRRLLLIEASAFPKPNTRPLLHTRRSRTHKPRVIDIDRPETWRVSFRCFTAGPRRTKAPNTAAAARLERLRQLGAQPGEPIFIARNGRAPKTPRATAPRALSLSKGGANHTALRQAQGSYKISRQDRFWVHEDDLKARRFFSAIPLAGRYEALLRVFNDPTPYARRLARRLHATPHRLAETLRAPPDIARRVDQFDDLGSRAAHAWQAHFSSA